MTERAAELRPDHLVGSYRLGQEIGRGGMGTVYEARHVVLPRNAAIKIMHAELRSQPGMATRIVQEAAILEAIRHPGVVRVFECNVLPDRRPWFAMELVAGDTLASRLSHHRTLPATEVARLLSHVADVLATAHAHGVVHRDLKPDNILLTPDDGDFPLRVIDWGVARLGPLGRITLDGLTPGTPIYMSPEQAAGRNIAAPCDIYSLGVIGYEALSGHPPFDGRTLAEVVCMHIAGDPVPLQERCTAPHALCDLVHRMLAKDASLRPGAIEVRQLARAIARDLSGIYESFELTEDDTVVVDPEALERGVTEVMPGVDCLTVIRKPRWTPDIGYAMPRGRAPAGPRCITPRAASDQVSGEISCKRR